MKKEPLILFITDTHLSTKNIDLVIDIFRQAIAKAKELGLKKIYHAGDAFDSRKNQSLATLMAFDEILWLFEEAGIELRIIPGNHDKPNYNSAASYLDIYQRHPNLTLTRTYQVFKEEPWDIHMIPFFDEKEEYPGYLKKANKAINNDLNILVTHVAVDGVKNNDGSEIEDTLSINGFSGYDKVIVGHYHNKQEVKNVHYIGSAFQKDFGEDEDKGLTLMYTDGSLERIGLDFPRFETVKIDLNTITPEGLEKKFKEYEKLKDENIRFKFSGTKEKLQSIDRRKFEKAGIDVKTEQDDPEIDMDYADLVDFKGFDPKKILEEWDEFGEKHKIDEGVLKNGKDRLEVEFKKHHNGD